MLKSWVLRAWTMYASSKQRREGASTPTPHYHILSWAHPPFYLHFGTLTVSHKQLGQTQSLSDSHSLRTWPPYTGQKKQLCAVFLFPYPSCWSFQLFPSQWLKSPNITMNEKILELQWQWQGSPTLTESKSHVAMCQCSTQSIMQTKYSKLVGLNQWVVTLWGLKDLFTGVTYQICCLSDIYIMTHSNRKLQLWSCNENNIVVGSSHHNMRNCIKGSQHWVCWKPLF